MSTVEQIRGDINQFKRLMTVVDFAVKSVEELETREAQTRSLDTLIAKQENELADIAGQVEHETQILSDTKEQATRLLVEAQENASALMSRAKDAAEKIINDAKQREDDALAHVTEINAEINRLGVKLSTVKAALEERQAEFDKITGSIEEVLAKVNPKGA